jgi:hypothetical protein
MGDVSSERDSAKQEGAALDVIEISAVDDTLPEKNTLIEQSEQSPDSDVVEAHRPRLTLRCDSGPVIPHHLLISLSFLSPQDKDLLWNRRNRWIRDSHADWHVLDRVSSLRC